MNKLIKHCAKIYALNEKMQGRKKPTMVQARKFIKKLWAK